MPDGPWYSTRAESSPRQSHAGHSHLRTGSPACPGPGTQTRLLFLFSFDKGKTGGCMSISCRSVQTARANINGSLLRRSSFPWALSSQQPLLSDGSSLRSWTNFLGRGLLRPRGTNSSRLFSPSDAVTKDFFLNAGPYVRVCVCVCVCVCVRSTSYQLVTITMNRRFSENRPCIAIKRAFLFVRPGTKPLDTLKI